MIKVKIITKYRHTLPMTQDSRKLTDEERNQRWNKEKLYLDFYRTTKEELAKFPPKIRTYFLSKLNEDLTSFSNYIFYDESMEDRLQDFLISNHITKKKLIDIKYSTYGDENFDSDSALVIYESKWGRWF